jgi:DNA-binding NtrC family response regulator
MPDAVFVLVDDEKPVLDSLKQELRRGFGARFAYETAESVSEAWDVIDGLDEEGATIVVVVSDWLMPDVRGDAFLKELAERHPATVRIMLTGHASNEAIRDLESGAAAHEIIHKPWDEQHLRALIERGLSL